MIESGNRSKGFTLLELMVVTAIFLVLVILLTGLFIRMLNAWGLEEGINDINASARTTQMRVFEDIIEAGLVTDASVGLTGLTVLDANGDPVAEGVAGPGIVFQRPQLPSAAEAATVISDQNGDGVINMIDVLLVFPATLAGTQWTTPITIRLYNEDVNGNFMMDEGEDLNDNGILESVVFREQDGVETRIIGVHTTGLEFELNGSQLDVEITMSRRLSSSNMAEVGDSLAFSVILEN